MIHPGNSPKEFLFLVAFALPCMSIVICYARIFYIVRRTAIRSREPALKPGISTRTIDRPANNNNNNHNSNNSNSNEEQQPQQHFTAVHMTTNNNNNNCDNLYENRRSRRASSSVEQQDGGDDNVITRTTSEKRRCFLTKVKDEDLKFIDTSIDSDNNNYLIRNMTTTGTGIQGPQDVEADERLSVEIVSEDEEAHGNGLLSADKTDSALEDDKEEESTGATDAKTTTTMTMNGSQYLAVLVEPSSSSGIDVALDQEEPIQPM